MRILLFHPEWSRSCADCLSWLYADDGSVVKRCGQPQPRPKGTPTPCHKCPKIPEGAEPVRQNAVELTEQNYRAYLHYLESRAVGRTKREKNDPIVRRNARILRALQDEYDQRPLWKLFALVSLGYAK